MKLYDYQQDMLRRIVEALARVNSVMVQMPTGTGKTVVMAATVKWFLDTHEGNVWIVAHRKELVDQAQLTVDRFLNSFGFGKLAKRVKVLSVQWLNRHLGEMADERVGLIVVDEAHHAIADTYQDIFEAKPMSLKIGMTATPCRMKKQSFGTLFQRLLPSPPTSDFIKLGYLAPYNYVVIGKFSAEQQIVDLLKGRGSDGDYAVREMDEKLNIPQAIQRLYQSVRKYADGKKGIVYAIDIDHARAIAACYSALGIKAVALDSKTPAKERMQMVEAFRRGELDCLVNVNLFDEGFDCPDVEYIQMARPTLSLAKYLQMVGRGLRINQEDRDKVCMIIDNVGNYRKFGYPDGFRDWASMFAGLVAGKGVVPHYVKKMQNMIAVDDEMVMVKRAETERKAMTPKELKTFKERVVPFMAEKERLMGLKSGDEIVLRPMYCYISHFTGDYAIFRPRHRQFKYGVLDRYGYVIVPAEYRGIKFLNEHSIAALKANGRSDVISLS